MKSNGKRLLWVYEKGHEPRCSVPEAEAYQKDFYSFDKNGTRNVDTERWSAQLEKRIAQLITELVSSKREPTGAEKTCLAVFMGTMYTRTPLGDNSATSVFRPATSQMLKRVAADAIEFRELYFSMDPRFRDWEHEKTIDQVWQGILSGKTDALEAGDHFRLASIIEVGITVGEVLCEMGWRFIYAPDGHRSSHPTIRW